MKFRSAICILLLLVLPQLLRCQQNDLRLTAEVVDRSVPSDARIESAARIGNRTLVVWGSKDTTDDGQPVGVLRMQMIDANLPTDTERALHSQRARPSLAVRVFPIGETFVVVWNDRREIDPGLYMARIDTEGRGVGGEEYFSIGSIAKGSDIDVRLTSEGAVIVWNDTRNGRHSLHARRLDESGRMIGEDVELGPGTFSSIVGFSELPGLALVVCPSAPGFVIRDDGSVDSRTIPAGHLIHPYHLAGDTSMAVLDDSTLALYKTPFDSLPLRQIELAPRKDEVAGTRVIGRDTTGNLIVAYVAAFPFDGTVGYAVVRGSLDSIGIAVSVDSLFMKGIYLPDVATVTYTQSGESIQQCDNNSLFTVTFDFAIKYLGQPVNHQLIQQTYSQRRGEILQATSGVGPWNCAQYDVPPLRRASSDNWSSIFATINGTEVKVVHVIPDIHVNATATAPNLLLRDTTLLVTWSSFDHRLMANLGEWKFGSGAPLTSFSTVDIQGESGSRVVTTYPYPEYYSNQYALLVIPGTTTIVRMKYWSHYVLSGTAYAVDESSADALVATRSGWLTAMIIPTGGNVGAYPKPGSSDYYPCGTSFDPNARGTLLGVAGISTARFAEVSEDGTPLWNVSMNRDAYVNRKTRLMGRGKQEFFCAVSDTLALYQGSSRQWASGFGYPSSESRFVRLWGTNFLRYFPVDSSYSTYMFELFGSGGTLIRRRLLMFDGESHRPVVVQRPRDSAIVVLADGAAGVRMSYLDQLLRPVVDTATSDSILNLRISATGDSIAAPSGTFRNDTLFVVWQDFRNGGSDIYGNYWIPNVIAITTRYQRDTTVTPADTSGTPHDTTVTPRDSTEAPITTMPIHITGVSPNPTRDEVTIEFDIPAPLEITIEFFDVLGRRRVSEQVEVLGAGHHVRTLDLRGFDPGTYTVVVRSGSARELRRVILLD